MKFTHYKICYTQDGFEFVTTYGKSFDTYEQAELFVLNHDVHPWINCLYVMPVEIDYPEIDGKAVVDIEWEHDGYGNDGISYAVSAYFIDNTALDEDQLEQLTNKYSQLGDEARFERDVAKAEAWAEGER